MCDSTDVEVALAAVENIDKVSNNEESDVKIKDVFEGYEGTAPIKKEFLIPKEELVSQAMEGLNLDASQIGELKEKNKQHRKDRKGMNKNRRKDMRNQETRIRASGVRLCPSVIQPVICRFGEKCSSEHNLKTYLENKPEDIGTICPVFEARGKCPYSYTCRFGKAHIDAEGNQIEKEPSTPYSETRNSSSMHIQVGLRKRTYDFKRADETVAAYKEGSLGAMEREPRKLDVQTLSKKKYLAPLTTVGNLPFRRLCVELGAEITCGEMALATSILAGTPSEYSLMKRHPSEKIFGVQLAGGFADTMSKAAQIVVDEFDVDFIDINMGCPIDVVNQKGGGCALPNRPAKLFEVVSSMRHVMGSVPLSVKVRTGLKDGVLTVDETIKSLVGKPDACPDMFVFHPRSKEQRYKKLAHWEYVPQIAEAAGEVPLWVCGDIYSWEDYHERLENNPIGGVMIGRGALIKPWLFTEIEEKRTWDISAQERFDYIKKFVSYGLDHWGSDDTGVEKTRKFLLEWLSFTYRYIPVGLLEVLPQRINDRPGQYRGRNDLETLLASPRAADWLKITEMLLGPCPEGFTFIPKHKASSY